MRRRPGRSRFVVLAFAVGAAMGVLLAGAGPFGWRDAAATAAAGLAIAYAVGRLRDTWAR